MSKFCRRAFVFVVIFEFVEKCLSEFAVNSAVCRTNSFVGPRKNKKISKNLSFVTNRNSVGHIWFDNDTIIVSKDVKGVFNIFNNEFDMYEIVSKK